MFLPAYSPDFNPIECAFSKLKTFLRQAKARTQATLEAAITAGLATITSQTLAAGSNTAASQSRSITLRTALEHCSFEFA